LFFTDPQYSHSWCLRSDICLKACENISDRGSDISLRSLILEATELVEREQIVHIPSILYHRCEVFTNRNEAELAKTILEDFMRERQPGMTIETHDSGGLVLQWPLPAEPPLVSIIIPTRDCGKLLRRCILSITHNDDGRVPFEIIVVDNDSTEDATLKYLDELAEEPYSRVVKSPGPFNYSQINNRAVESTKGEVLLFLNNDVEAISSGWLAAMASHAIRPEIGAVGAKLLYGDHTVQHGGVILGIGGVAGHAHKYFQADSNGYQRRLQVSQNVSAVTGAALAIRKCLFDAVGGFDEEQLKVNYNDVDLCLKLLKAGYRNLFCAEAVLIHHESKSRGVPVEGQPQYQQWQEEREVMQGRWASLLAHDPYYSPHLSLTEEDFSIRMNKNITPKVRTSVIYSEQ
jgi:GT2 family glycosyltransferase